MRGEILNEFLEFAADDVGPEVAAELTARDGRRAGGCYEAACRYELGELVHLAGQVATALDEPLGAVVARFGKHLFGYFAALYPTFLADATSAVGLLAGIDTYVHGELRNLYPDAEFPFFECAPIGSGGLEMTYRSTRPLADLAEGLIRGCVDHFGDPIRIDRENLPGAPGTSARFRLTPER